MSRRSATANHAGKAADAIVRSIERVLTASLSTNLNRFACDKEATLNSRRSPLRKLCSVSS